MQLSAGMPRLAVILLLALLFVLSLWTGPRSLQAFEGCPEIFNATTRGGARVTSTSGGLFSCSISREPGEVRVTRVIDGDTIVIQGGERVRYLGVDTPEISGRPEPYGVEAKEFNKRLVEGRIVRLDKNVSERDRYGRLLRYVYVDGVQVNAELIREGYARTLFYEPDTRYKDCFLSLEREAREAHRGMWGR